MDKSLGVSQKAASAAEGLKEQAEKVDKQFGVKRRVLNWTEDAQRKWPTWQRQVQAFQGTLPGQLLTGVALWFAISSGLAWRLLQALWLMSWLAPLLLLPVLRRFNQKAAAQQAASQAAAAAQQAQQARRRAWSPFGTAGTRPSGAQTARPRPYEVQQNDAPIIDAEFWTVDEGDH